MATSVAAAGAARLSKTLIAPTLYGRSLGTLKLVPTLDFRLPPRGEENTEERAGRQGTAWRQELGWESIFGRRVLHQLAGPLRRRLLGAEVLAALRLPHGLGKDEF